MNSKNRVLVLFSKYRYPEGNIPYAKHVDALNNLVTENKNKVRFYQGFLDELIFINNADGIKILDYRTGTDISDYGLVFFHPAFFYYNFLWCFCQQNQKK